MDIVPVPTRNDSCNSRHSQLEAISKTRFGHLELSKRCMDLTNEQWELLAPLIPEPLRRPDGKGRPRREPREVLNGILWILRTGAQWADLPERYPPYQTCHRRFQEWVREGVFQGVLEALAHDLEARGEIDLSECYVDATFVIAKKGGPRVGKTKRGKGSKIMAVADATGAGIACTLRLLARMRSPLYARLSHLHTSTDLQSG